MTEGENIQKVDNLTAEADRLIEKWTERQDARGEQEAEPRAQEPASTPAAPAPREERGLEVIPGETLVWKSLLWQVIGVTRAIPPANLGSQEEAVAAVVMRPLAPCARGWGRAERRRARLRGEKVRG